MIDCENRIEQISLMADGLLDGKDLMDLKSHMTFCTVCDKRFKAFTTLRAIMPSMTETPPKNLTSEILDHLSAENKRGQQNHLRRGLIYLSTAVAASVALILLIQGQYLGQRNNTNLWSGNLYKNDTADPAPDSMPDSTPMPRDLEQMPLPDTEQVLDENNSEYTRNIYASVIEISAKSIPDVLNEYPQIIFDDNRIGIELTVQDLQILWPELQAIGAVEEEASTENSLDREGYDANEVESDIIQEWTLIVVTIE